MPKNVQTTLQLHSFHMLARLCSKFFKLGFSSMWTKYFQIYTLGFEEAEERIKLSAFIVSWRKQGSSRKTSASLAMLKPLTVWITKNWKILQKMWTPDHLTCPLRNLYVGQESSVKTGHGTIVWFTIGKEVQQGCILSCFLFNFCAEYIMRNARLDESQAGIKVAWRRINNLRYADDTTVMAEMEEELKSLLMRVKKESEKTGLKLNIK